MALVQVHLFEGLLLEPLPDLLFRQLLLEAGDLLLLLLYEECLLSESLTILLVLIRGVRELHRRSDRCVPFEPPNRSAQGHLADIQLAWDVVQGGCPQVVVSRVDVPGRGFDRIEATAIEARLILDLKKVVVDLVLAVLVPVLEWLMQVFLRLLRLVQFAPVVLAELSRG